MVLTVNEIFTSIQGEGVHTGLVTTFVRLAGCDLRCSWCDTQYALSSDAGIPMTMDEILAKIPERSRLVCLTGGEPLLQHDSIGLIQKLLSSDRMVDLETNGSRDISPLPLEDEKLMVSMDIKTPSSKEMDSFHYENLKLIRKHHQLKFIIYDERDLNYSLELIKKKEPKCNLILTPCSNEGGERIANKLINKILEPESGWKEIYLDRIRLMIQTHKVIWSSDE